MTDKERFENAFPAVPDSVHMKLEQTLSEVEKMSMKKSRPVMVAALALVLVLALGGIAYAAVQGGVMEYLFGKGQSTPTDEQQQMVQTIGINKESNGVKMTVTDAVTDKMNFYTALSIETGKDVMLQCTDITINDCDVAVITSDFVNTWVQKTAPATMGFALTFDKDSQMAGMITTKKATDAFWQSYNAALAEMDNTGKARVKFTLKLYAPNKGIKEITDYSEDAVTQAYLDGYTPVLADGDYREILQPSLFTEKMNAAWAPIGELVSNVNATEADLEKAQELQDAITINDEQFTTYSNMTLLDTVTFEFTVNVSDQKTDVTPAEDIVTSDFRVHFNEVSFTALTSLFDFDIHTVDGGLTMDEIAENLSYFAFTDESGDEMRFQDTFYMTGAGPEEQPDGTMVYKVHYMMSAPESIPDTIHVIPTSYDPDIDTAKYSDLIQLKVK